MNLLLSYILIMLCRKNYCFQSLWSAVLIIFYRYLSLSIRSQIFQSAIFTNFCKLKGKFVCQRNRIRHVFLSLICSITKHHTLIAGTNCLDLSVRHFIFSCFKRFINTHSDIRGLLIQCNHNCTCMTIKSGLSSVISNLVYSITNDCRDIKLCFCSDLTCYKYETGTACSFTSDTAHRVLCHAGIQNRI